MGSALPLRELPSQYRGRRGDLRYESSPQVWRSFCPRCGTPLTYDAARCADEVHINIGTLGQPESFPPTKRVHVAEQLPWLRFADHVPRYAGSSRNAEPLARDAD